MSVSGSIESISLNGRNFAVAADSDVSRKLGGFENEIQANGNGTARLVKTRVPWGLDGLTIHVDDDRGDHEFLKDLADGNGFFPVSITFASGVTYQARGQVTGELASSSQNGTAGLNVSGPGEMTKQ